MSTPLASRWHAPFHGLPRPNAAFMPQGPSDGPALDVLVIEDDEPIRRALELSLGHLGHLVASAPTLGDARQLLRGIVFDIVICDFALPDGDALALVRDWPARARRVPAIAISGLRDATLGDRCLRAGFSRFIPKPLHVDVLARALRELTRSPPT